jgi:hypothetical protein
MENKPKTYQGFGKCLPAYPSRKMRREVCGGEAGTGFPLVILLTTFVQLERFPEKWTPVF